MIVQISFVRNKSILIHLCLLILQIILDIKEVFVPIFLAIADWANIWRESLNSMFRLKGVDNVIVFLGEMVNIIDVFCIHNWIDVLILLFPF